MTAKTAQWALWLLDWHLGSLGAVQQATTLEEPVPSPSKELTTGIHADTSLVQPEWPSVETVGRSPAMVADRRCPGPQFFALVDASDPDRVYYYGIDVGTQAFTVRRDPASQQTAFVGFAAAAIDYIKARIWQNCAWAIEPSLPEVQPKLIWD